MMGECLSIAVAQTCPVAGDVEANTADHLDLVDVAASEGAQVVLFPELSLTGYEPSLARSLAFSEHDARLRPLKAKAADRSITIVVGAPIELTRALHIGAFIIRPTGGVLIYTKQRLGAFAATAGVDGIIPPREDSVFIPGTISPGLDIGGTAGALAICADAGHSTHAARAAHNGAKIYLASMFVIPSDFEKDELKLASYAREHAMIVAMANFGAPSGGLSSAGQSSIWSEHGELVARLGVAGAGIAVASRSSAGWRARTMTVPMHRRFAPS